MEIFKVALVLISALSICYAADDVEATTCVQYGVTVEENESYTLNASASMIYVPTAKGCLSANVTVKSSEGQIVQVAIGMEWPSGLEEDTCNTTDIKIVNLPSGWEKLEITCEKQCKEDYCNAGSCNQYGLEQDKTTNQYKLVSDGTKSSVEYCPSRQCVSAQVTVTNEKDEEVSTNIGFCKTALTCAESINDLKLAEVKNITKVKCTTCPGKNCNAYTNDGDDQTVCHQFGVDVAKTLKEESIKIGEPEYDNMDIVTLNGNTDTVVACVDNNYKCLRGSVQYTNSKSDWLQVGLCSPSIEDNFNITDVFAHIKNGAKTVYAVQGESTCDASLCNSRDDSDNNGGGGDGTSTEGSGVETSTSSAFVHTLSFVLGLVALTLRLF